MESSLSSRLIIPKNVIKKINPNKVISHKFRQRNVSTIKTNYATLSEELNTSWDFTPFPDLYFPSQKNQMIKKINRLNFEKGSSTPINLDYKNNFRNMSNIGSIPNKQIKRKIIFDLNKIKIPRMEKSNSLSNLFQEKKGDITKHKSPSYTFGLSRNECKFPFIRLNEKISPGPCSYNLRPLEGLGGSSLKFSFNKHSFLKKFKQYITPGPGHYNLDKYDLKNNGNIIPSHLLNSKIVNFAKYEERKNNKGINSPENIRPDPGSYDINNTLTMFSGTGRYPISNFRSNISKTISKINVFSRNYNNFIYPGPGHYNHYSIFTSHS
jgi:hypothetical protein